MEPTIPPFEVSAAEVNRRFREIRERAREGPVTVTRHGHPVLALLDIDHFRAIVPAPPAAESLGLLGMIVDNLRDGFVMIDRDWSIRIVNRVTELFLGKSRDELIGQPFESIFGGAEHGREMARRSMDSGEILSREGVSEIRGDRTIVLTSFPMPRPWDGVGFFFANITEQERLRRKLGEADALIDALLDCSDGRIVLVADLDGRVRRWNATAERLLGLPADRLAGQPLAELVEDRSGQLAIRTSRAQPLRAEGKAVPFDAGTLLVARPLD